MDTERPAPEQSGDVLTGQDWSQGVEVDPGPSLTAQISNAMVGLKKRFYGKGPTRSRTFICENYIITVLEGGLLPHEEVLLEAGEEDQVRQHRLAFQSAMEKPTIEAITQLTERDVLTYHSQIVFRPTCTFELFVLDKAP
jgi:uncharacterized protein YbcI